MKILHTVQRYFPDIGGSEEVVRQLSEYLVSFGHEVVVATSYSPGRTFDQLNGVRIEQFRCSGNSVDGIHGEADRYRQFLGSAGADVMMNYAAQIWSTDLAYELLPTLPCAKVIVPCGYSRLRDPSFTDYYRQMPEVLRRYAAVIYLSDNYIDAEFGREHQLTNGIVIPNAASEKEFSSRPVDAFRQRYGLQDQLVVLNVSNHSTAKNHCFFWNVVRMFPRTAIAPVMIGNAYRGFPRKWIHECYAHCRVDAMRSRGLLLEHAPRSDVVDAYMDADVFLFGSKIECSPLVMFESFASKTLFVTTDCGNVKDYEDIVCIVKDEHEARRVIEDFMKHPDHYDGRIEKGYRLFRERLHWKAISREYEKLYRDIVMKSRNGS
ncbi:MAG TPA: glycosyltransferase family 4 protein [Bacteroidota bacterium]|nr:glycosyltransferase family 4 protein [Bacteroidota bacterium]